MDGPGGTPLEVVLQPAHAHVHTCRHSSCIHTYTQNYTHIDSDTCTETLTIYTFNLYLTYSCCSCGIVTTTCQAKIVGHMSLLFQGTCMQVHNIHTWVGPSSFHFFPTPISSLFLCISNSEISKMNFALSLSTSVGYDFPNHIFFSFVSHLDCNRQKLKRNRSIFPPQQ